MIKHNNDIIDFDLLQKGIEQEISASHIRIAQEPDTVRQEQECQPVFFQTEVSRNYFYSIDDFLQYNGETFVHYCYRQLLKREADPGGLKIYGEGLKNGMKKTTLMLHLSLSAEGKLHAVKVEGLWGAWLKELIGSKLYPQRLAVLLDRLQQKAAQLPLIGETGRWFSGLLSLGRTDNRLKAFISDYQQQLIQQNAVHDKLQHELQNTQAELQSTQDGLQSTQAELQNTQAELQHTQAEQQNTQAEVQHTQAEQQKLALEFQQLRTQLASFVYELRQLESPSAAASVADNKKQAAPAIPCVSGAATAAAIKFDNFYLAFENQFRGEREDIKGRLRVYLPFITAVYQQSGIDKSVPLLDLGCGRGEWLELLSDEHYNSIGIDINEAMVCSCQALNLSVQQADVMSFLRHQRDESFAVISGFHIIEHLPFAVLLDLFDESLRLLKPGGLIIFETPNPENILVGSHTFYYDSTHKNPLPPLLIEFLAQHRGFSEVKIERLNPYPEHLQVPAEDGIAGQHINRFIYGAQDYAVIASKGFAAADQLGTQIKNKLETQIKTLA